MLFYPQRRSNHFHFIYLFILSTSLPFLLNYLWLTTTPSLLARSLCCWRRVQCHKRGNGGSQRFQRKYKISLPCCFPACIFITTFQEYFCFCSVSIVYCDRKQAFGSHTEIVCHMKGYPTWDPGPFQKTVCPLMWQNCNSAAGK